MFWVIALTLVVIYLTLDRIIRVFKVGNYCSKYVFITGCGSGFGRELAIRLDRMGFPVLAACRRQESRRSLEEICSSRLVTLTLDVADGNSIQEALKFVKHQLPHENSLWAVVNNAGIMGVLAPMELSPLDNYISTCHANLFGPIEVSRTFAPLLRKSQGRLIFMSSLSGRCPLAPGAYSVSKFGLEAFGDVCRRELAPFGVKVCIIEPGFFKTSILNEEVLTNDAKRVYDSADSELRGVYAYQHDQILATISDAKDVASPAIYKVTNAYLAAITSLYPRSRYTVGLDMKMVFVPLSFLPEWIMDWVLTRRRKRRDVKVQTVE